MNGILKLIGAIIEGAAKANEPPRNPWWPTESLQPKLVFGNGPVVVGKGFLRNGERHEIPISHHLYPAADYTLKAVSLVQSARFLVEIPGVGRGDFGTVTYLDGVAVDKNELMLKEISGWNIPGLRDPARCVDVPTLDCRLSIKGANPPTEEPAGGGKMYRGYEYIAHITCVFGEGQYELVLESHHGPIGGPSYPWTSPNWPVTPLG
jgi:hypothetical protein